MATSGLYSASVADLLDNVRFDPASNAILFPQFQIDLVTHLQSTSAHPLKRTERSSPCRTPSGLTQTPAAKHRRRNRTGTEQGKPSQPNPTNSFARCTLNSTTDILHSKLLSDFQPTPTELTAINELQSELHSYMFLRFTTHNVKEPESTFLGIQQFFSLVRANNTEKSHVQYLEGHNDYFITFTAST